MVGKIILWCLLGILVLLALLMLLPAVLYIDYRCGDFTVKARILFVKLTVFPFKPTKSKTPKKPKKTKKKKEEPQEPTKEEPKKKKTLQDWITLIKRIATSASAGFKVIIKHLRIRDVVLVVPVHCVDAADTALQCGRVQALLGGTHAVLENVVNIQYKELAVIPDYVGNYREGITFSCKIGVAPVIMLIAGAVGFKRFLAMRPKRKPRPAPQNHAQANAVPSAKGQVHSTSTKQLDDNKRT